MNVAAQVARRSFSAKTMRSLSRKGIEVIGSQLVPNGDSWINPDVAFLVATEGTCKVWTFQQVRAAAGVQ
jgi:hypothetical protein